MVALSARIAAVHLELIACAFSPGDENVKYIGKTIKSAIVGL